MAGRFFRMILLLVCVVAVFVACRSNLETDGQSRDLTRHTSGSEMDFSDLRLLTKWNGVCSGAAGEQGFYDLQIENDGSMHMMYLDYATGLQTVLCASPSCQHQDDSCSAWIPANQGGVVPLVVEDKLLLLSRGSDSFALQNSCQPQIICMDLNGSKKVTLLQLEASEELLPPFVGNKEMIVCKYRKHSADDGAVAVQDLLVAISLEDGHVTKLADFFGSSSTIVGAAEACLFLQSVSGSNFSLFALDLNTGKKNMISSWGYAEKVMFTTQTGCGFVCADGHIEFYRAPAFEKQDLTDTVVPADEKIGLEAISFVESFDDKVIFEIFHPGDTPRGTYVEEYGVDLSDGTCRELTLRTDFDGVTEPVEIISVLDERLLVVSDLSYQEIMMPDENDMPIKVQSIGNQYALIDKNDYWDSVANYTLFESIWF